MPKPRRVEWLREALRNLDEIAAHIARDDPAAAARAVARLREAVGALAEQPSMGRTGRVTGTRELVVARTHFVVPYRVRDDRVEIIRVFHSAQRWPDSL